MPRKVAPCGTLTAYNRHRRNGEQACDACLGAKGQDQARRRAERAAEQATAAAEVRESMKPEDLTLELLKEQRAVLRSLTLSELTPPQSVAGLSKQLVAVQDRIDDLERVAAKKASQTASTTSGPSGLGDLAARRAERERERREATGN